MEILREFKQINNALTELFGHKLFEDSDESFIQANLNDEYIKNLMLEVADIAEKKQELQKLSELVFQLKDYIPALCNLTKMFLYSSNFDAVYNFVTKLFISHIGTINYQSTQSSNIIERYFDRFIEIVKNCNISHEAYVPFLLEIFSPSRVGGIAQWKNPAVEYLQTFFNKNEQWAMNFLKENKILKYDLLEAISTFNTPKGISLVIEDYLSGEDVDKEQTLHILKKYKRDTFMAMDKMISDGDVNSKKLLIELLCEFDNDVESMTRLNELYEKERNEEIKSIIAQKIGVVESMSIKNEKQFVFAVRKSNLEPQERSLNVGFDKLKLRYKSGYETDNLGKTFMLYLFKQEKNLYNLKKLYTLNEIFESEDLTNFACTLWNVLKKKEDINQAKWVIRMVSMFGDRDTKNEMLEFQKELIIQKRYKEARYIAECFINLANPHAIEMLKLLVYNNIIEEDKKQEYINIINRISGVDKESICDELVCDEFDDETYQREKKRLYYSFIAGRTYTEELFDKLFLEKPLFKKMAEGLVFGEYVFGKLYNAFILENNQKNYIIGEKLNNDKKYISIIHSLDLDDRFENISAFIEKPTFNQFAKSRFNVNDFSRNEISVSCFNGMFVSLDKFAEKMQERDFIINKAYDEVEFASFVHILKNINVCTELSLEKKTRLGQPSATLGDVHFLRLEDVLCDKGKYLTSRANAISVGALSYRYFDYVLNAIYESGHLQDSD